MTHTASFDVLIVGAGHGGAQAAIALRQGGFAGSIALVTDELEFPYERPPLSKEYFSGEKTLERIRLRPPAFWAARDIKLMLGERIEAIDPASHRAATRSGENLSYGKLVWAAGGSPRRLGVAAQNAGNVLYMRTLANADRLKALSKSASSIAVIGGGYIGLEAAAALTKAGKSVILIEALDRVLARVAGEDLSRYVEQAHRACGVSLKLGTTISRYEGAGQVKAIGLSDGTRIACDLVVAGIGIIPEIGVLKAAGAQCADGVDVDEYCQTSLPDIFAIGDCAAHRNAYANGASIRLESVQNAVDMAKTAADSIMGTGQGYAAVPWFWSHQYDLKIQTVGLSRGYDATVVRGDMAAGAFAIVYLREGRVIALDCVNSARDYVQGRALVAAGARIPMEQLAQAQRSLKDLAPVEG